MTILFAPFAAKHPNFNGTGSPKNYPFSKELVSLIIGAGHNLIQVGAEGEEAMVSDFRTNLSFDGVGELISTCDTAICVDSYLQHHMWFLNKKAIVLWGVSDPLIFGHSLHLNLLKDRSYLRPNQYDLYYQTDHKPEAFVSPTEVVEALNTTT